MPTFSRDGNDEYICQQCAGIFDSVHYPSRWLPVPRRENGSSGNLCPRCAADSQAAASCSTAAIERDLERERDGRGPISLQEHCREESGGLTGAALDSYINRYYGHG